MRYFVKFLLFFTTITGLAVVGLYMIFSAIDEADDHDYFWE